jgi:hypothetical protein
MPTVDEDGLALTAEAADQIASLDREQFGAVLAKRRCDEAHAHWRMLSNDAIAATRVARAAMGTPEFEALFTKARDLHRASNIAENAYTRARENWFRRQPAAKVAALRSVR